MKRYAREQCITVDPRNRRRSYVVGTNISVTMKNRIPSKPLIVIILLLMPEDTICGQCIGIKIIYIDQQTNLSSRALKYSGLKINAPLPDTQRSLSQTMSGYQDK